MIHHNRFILNIFAMFATILLFLAPLLNAWHLYLFGQESELTIYSALGGIIPWSDAAGYYSGANNLLWDGSLDYWNMRRPLNALLFSVRLWISNGDFKIALILQAILCALSAFWVAKTVSQTFGKMAGFLTLAVLFIFASVFIPTTLSETLGLTLGSLSFIALWQAIQQPQKVWIFFIAGCFLMIAQNTRAGALFIFPLLVIWLGYQNNNHSFQKNKFQLRIPLFFIFGIIIAFLYNLLLIKVYGASTDGTMHGNFATTLYGLVAGGKGWLHAYQTYPDIAATSSEAAFAQFLFSKSFELFKSNPSLLVLGFLKGIGGLTKGFISFFQRDLSQNLVLKISIRFLGTLFLGFMLFRWKSLYKDYKKEIGLISICLFGMLISAGFIWADGSYRVFAATVPFLAAAVGIVLGTSRKIPFLLNLSKINSSSFSESRNAIWLGSVLIIAALFIPLHFKLSSHTVLPVFHCAANEKPFIIQNIQGIPYLNIEQNKEAFKNLMLKSVNENKEKFVKLLDLPGLSQTPILALIYNLNTKTNQLVIAPSKLFEQNSARIGICTAPLPEPEATDLIVQVKSFEGLHEQ